MLVSTAVALGLAEVIVRQAKLSKTWSSYLDGRVLMDTKTLYGGRVGYRRVPDSTFTSARDIIFVTNKMGFRERNPDTVKNGKKRIAFIGDSVTEGFGVETNDRFTNLIEKYLNEKGLKAETINFAVSGHATIDQIQVLNNFILPLKPDMVCLQMCFNDFKRNMDMLKPAAENIASAQAQQSFSVKSFLQQNSALYLLFAEKYNYYKLKSGVPNNLLPTASSIPGEEWDLTVKYLDEIHAVCKRENIEFLISYVPLEVEVLIQDPEKSELTNNQIRNYCDQREIPYIEVTSALRSYQDGKMEKLYLDDCHLSVEGNRVVASRLTESLLQYLNP